MQTEMYFEFYETLEPKINWVYLCQLPRFHQL